MENTNTTVEQEQNLQPIHWGHFGIILGALLLLSAVTFMEKPELFSFKKTSTEIADANAPHYIPYVTPQEDLPQPAVLGATTNPGPSIINEDGSVAPVDMGQVLGASTQDVVVPISDIKVNSIPDSQDAINVYLNASRQIEADPVDNSAFETALSSGNQTLINSQASKMIAVKDSLLKLLVPIGFVKLQQLKIAQYNAAIGVLQNFTQADSNPQLVGQYLNVFLKSQQDLDSEVSLVAKKYNLDPAILGSVTPDTTSTNAQ